MLTTGNPIIKAIKTEIEHLKIKAEEIKAKVANLSNKPEHEDELHSLKFELDDLANRINSILPH